MTSRIREFNLSKESSKFQGLKAIMVRASMYYVFTVDQGLCVGTPHNYMRRY